MAKDIWTSMRTDFALDALEQALYDRETVGQLIPSVDTSNPATDRHFKTGHHDDGLRLVIGSA